ncbi:RNA binding S1 domain containing protein [Nitzschia inconspicua]|uniref:RNA binding S1 domain containing protein n=1 Tax=Nitzschia inconspicua TaxID=303405 RepID=A0A9K3LKN7_9STRA|nr:RNA binding S1 domain containing protein [Nitzschia inconspicua]
MIFNKGTLALWCATIGSAAAFNAPNASTRLAFVTRAARSSPAIRPSQHGAGCPCSSCVGTHPASCPCDGCSSFGRRSTMLFADAVEADATATEEGDDVPEEVVAMDGVDSNDEAHNVDRPARQQLKKKKAKGKELSEFEVGSTVTGTVRALASYGAFVDIGATTDGLLHISQLSIDYVGDVTDVLKEGQEVQVRIVNIDSGKGQVGLSLLSAAEEATSQENAQQAREARQSRSNNRNQSNNRRSDNTVLTSLAEKGWDSSTMVEGTVVSTVDFGCFVRVDASKLNSECEGEFDGLVHISALRSGRVGSVTDVVKANDTVQVRVKSIDGNKVSLTMLSADDEALKVEAAAERGANYDGGFDEAVGNGAANWKELVVDFETEMPSFQNLAVVEDRRK